MTPCRHRAATVAAAILVLAAATTVHAEASLFGGFNFPTGEFAKVTTSGWSFGGYATRDVLPGVAAGGSLTYTDFVVDNTDLNAGLRYGPSLSAWEFAALGKVNILSVRGIVGLGLANYSGIDDSGDSTRKSGFAWQLGVAAPFFFLEGQLAYHQITTDGGSANWIGLTGGMLF